MRQKADKSSGAIFNKLLCIHKSTTGRMTLFSESGILSVKTGGQREIAQMEEQEKQRLFEIAGKYEDCVYIEVSSVHSGS